MKPKTFRQGELDNDSTLRWNPYKLYELLWSDAHERFVRFLSNDGDHVLVATRDSIKPLPLHCHYLQVRRPSGQEKE